MTVFRGIPCLQPAPLLELHRSAKKKLSMLDLTAVVLLLTSPADVAPQPVSSIVTVALVTQQPDTRKAKPLGRWANGQDIAKLQSAEGQPRWLVLLILGHPSALEQQANGVEVWDYPWVGACRVWFKDGKCSGTFYTAGY